MCLTCGCMQAHNRHGKPDYLTYEDLAASAALDSQTVTDAIKTMNKTLNADRTKHESEYDAVLKP